MKIVTTRELLRTAKNIFTQAETERVSIKRGNKFVNLIVSDDPSKAYVDEDWLKEFMSIPMEYRCNPFEISPDGDLYFADKRNVDKLNKSIAQAKAGNVTKVSGSAELKAYLDSL